ncbi:hypothetical protein ABTL03_19940, partial [Acinetobacter baumannii]
MSAVVRRLASRFRHPRNQLCDFHIHQEAIPETLKKVIDQAGLPIQNAQPENHPINKIAKRAETQGQMVI